MTQQIILDFLPGYYWDGFTVKSTGAALPPTQHISPKNGELQYYVKPIGWGHSAYIRHKGLLEYIQSVTD
jgi:hypothetical protein